METNELLVTRCRNGAKLMGMLTTSTGRATVVRVCDAAATELRMRGEQVPVAWEAIERQLNPATHCFREDNCADHPDHDSDECCCCGRSADEHTGCDCWTYR